MTDSVGERVATLEANSENTVKAVGDIENTLHSLNEKVGRIEIKMEKSMSFVGGIAFTFSLFGALFVFVAKYILSKMGVDI